MAALTLLHLTDLHAGQSDSQFGIISEAFMEDVRDQLATRLFHVDYVVFSGDLVHSGKSEQFQALEEFLGGLWALFPDPKPKLISVPGNHDLCRPNASAQKKVERNRIALVDGKQEPDISPFENYISWWRSTAIPKLDIQQSAGSPLNFVAYVPYADGTGRVEVICINSATTHLSDKLGEAGKLIVAPSQYIGFTLPKEKSNLSILITHHPLDELDEAVYANLDESIISTRPAMIRLCGHMHSRNLSVDGGVGNPKLVHVVQGEALMSSKWRDSTGAMHDRRIGYSIIHIESRSDEIAFRIRAREATRARGNPYTFSFARNVAKDSGFRDGNWSPEKVVWQSPREIGGHNKKGTITSPIRNIVPKGFTGSMEQIDELDELFAGLIVDPRRPGERIEKPITTILNCIANLRSGKTLHLAGNFGVGKSLLLAVLYISYVQTHPQEAGTIKWIDPRVTGDLETASGKDFFKDTSLLFLVGLPFEGSDRLVPTNVSRVVSEVNHEISAGNIFHLVKGKEEARWVAIAAYWRGEVLDHAHELPIIHGLETVCRQLLLEPDYFLARVAITRKIENWSFAVSLKKYLTNLVAENIQGEDAKNIKNIDEILSKIAEAEYLSWAGIAERLENLDPKIAAYHSRLIQVHPVISSFLIASHEIALIILLGTQITHKKFSEAERLVTDLNFVFPHQVNTFTKDLLADCDHSTLRYFDAALDWALNPNSPKIRTQRLLRANFAYLKGRRSQSSVNSQGSIAVLTTLKERLEIDLAEIEASRISLTDAVKKRFSDGYQRSLALLLIKQIASHEEFERCSSTTNFRPNEINSWLTAGNNAVAELKLAIRSIYISLATLDDLHATSAYLTSIMIDPDADSLNRGFHRDYYGDIREKRSRAVSVSFLSNDNDLGPCDKTIYALELGISNKNCPHAMRQIMAFTLGSLVRVRCEPPLKGGRSEGLDSQIIDRVTKSLSQFLNEQPAGGFSEDVRNALASFVRELKSGGWLVEKYIDDLYEIKYRRRNGWPDSLNPPESVAAHSFLALVLGQMLLPTQLDKDFGELKQTILNYVACHDLAEAITSDIPSPKKTEEQKEIEAQVTSQIARIGLLTGSREASLIGEYFKEFESPTTECFVAKLSRDLDKLDMLIQAYRYRRDHGGHEFDRWNDFVKSCKPEKFLTDEVRLWAIRFIDYFTGLASNKADSVSNDAEGLWPFLAARESFCSNRE